MRNIDISEFSGKAKAIVFSGGVVKAAAWHLGVAQALEESGFQFKSNTSQESPYEIGTYVGSSAGSIISTYLANGYRPADIIQATLDPKNAKLKPISYKEMLSLKKSSNRRPQITNYQPLEGLPLFLRKVLGPIINLEGIFTTHGLHDYFLNDVIESNLFEDYKADLFIVATQLDHSRKVIFSKYKYPNPSHDSTSVYYTKIPISKAIAATTSVPPFYCPYPVFNPVSNQTDYYIDGEIRETLSTHVAVDHGCETIISSWTHTPYHWHDEVGSLVNYGLPAICTQAIYLMIQKKIVTHRANLANMKDVLDTVNDYLIKEKFQDDDRKRFLNVLERKLHYKRGRVFIDIYPSHNDFPTFFKNSFSLNPDKLSEIVSAGYKKTIKTLRSPECFLYT